MSGFQLILLHEECTQYQTPMMNDVNVTVMVLGITGESPINWWGFFMVYGLYLKVCSTCLLVTI